jgi:hypothetical protein
MLGIQMVQVYSRYQFIEKPINGFLRAVDKGFMVLSSRLPQSGSCTPAAYSENFCAAISCISSMEMVPYMSIVVL